MLTASAVVTAKGTERRLSDIPFPFDKICELVDGTAGIILSVIYPEQSLIEGMGRFRCLDTFTRK